MPIPPEIQSLIRSLILELEITEREANEGLSLVRPVLSSFPDNVRLIQFVALFNNGLLFVEEDLGILLGQCMEAKIRGKRILNILKDLA